MWLNDPERSWPIWQWMEATGWKFLPYAGGLLDQPDWLLRDLLTVSAISERVRKQVTEEDNG